MIKNEGVNQADVLRKIKDNLLESIDLLISLAREDQTGQHELYRTWSDRLEEIAKEYRHKVCVLEATYGDNFKDERMNFDTKYYIVSLMLQLDNLIFEIFDFNMSKHYYQLDLQNIHSS